MLKGTITIQLCACVEAVKEEEIDIILFEFVHGPICFSISPNQHEILSQQTEV
jgi:hypothetical protein